VKAVGTDPKMFAHSVLKSDAGLLTGALMPPPAIGARIPGQAKTADILADVVVGVLITEAGAFARRKSRCLAGPEALRKG
jgi:hypothetical protein